MLFALLCRPKISAFALTIAAAPALAESPAPTPPADRGTSRITLDTVEVISEKLVSPACRFSRALAPALIISAQRRWRPFRKAKTRH